MSRLSILAHAAAAACLALPTPSGLADDQPADEPVVRGASDEPTRALKRFRVPDGLKVEPFAAEPLLANPVAFGVDERNRFYVVETFRHGHGVTDTRGHMNWLDDDLASRTVADRVAMYRKYFKGEEFAGYGRASERLRLVEDRDGDGRADHASVFADGFRDVAAGLAAGVLTRRGDVYFACLPDLWLLRDRDGDGRADDRSRLQTGFGIHVGFLGHDLHGLRWGPDGRLYFSIGDRGLNVETEGRRLFYPDTGCVLRCEPDGSRLEVVATGLRNPQELAFDEFGNLFTVDNNSDSGDRARLVHVVEGGDSGWRIGFQFIESPNSRGPWNAEKMWHPRNDAQPAFLVPPLANLSDGPSGLTYHPGTGLLGESYRGHFFLADFRGSAGQSGVRSFAVQPDGASFKLDDSKQFFWGLEATDVDFGTDGALYVSDWVEGWNITGKGRLYKVFDPSKVTDPTAREVKALLAEGFESRSPDDLARLLAHPDQRVRQGAQFAIAARGRESVAIFGKAVGDRDQRLSRIHALWGLGQLGRGGVEVREAVAAVLRDDDPEVRAQAARVLGETGGDPGATAVGRLVALLGDEQPRVRFHAAIALGKLKPDDRSRAEAVAGAVRLLRANDDRDAYLRHAAAYALAGLASNDDLETIGRDASAAVRMGALLADRRRESPAIARFLGDPEPRLVLEAARAIADLPIDGAMPALASLADRPGLGRPLLRRVVSAQNRLGRPEDARALVRLAATEETPEPIRIEALDVLGDWANPRGRDRVTGLWRPLAARPAGPAAEAVAGQLDALLKRAPDAVRVAAAKAVARLGVREAGPLLGDLIADHGRSPASRTTALEALADLHDPGLAAVLGQATSDREPKVRAAGLRLLAGLSPVEAIPALESALTKGTIAEQQGAFATLGALKSDAADPVLAAWLDRLRAGEVAPEVRLDLIEAAAKRPTAEIKRKLAELEASRPKDDPLAAYRETLAGGDAGRGQAIFREKTEVSCTRCHKFQGQGGEVGPDLTGIGGKKPREAILEAIVAPNKEIAEGFETLLVATNDGQVHAGILKKDDGEALELMTPEAKLVRIAKRDVEDQTRGQSAMPEDTIQHLSRAELRDLVEFLAGSR